MFFFLFPPPTIYTGFACELCIYYWWEENNIFAETNSLLAFFLSALSPLTPPPTPFFFPFWNCCQPPGCLWKIACLPKVRASLQVLVVAAASNNSRRVSGCQPSYLPGLLLPAAQDSACWPCPFLGYTGNLRPLFLRRSTSQMCTRFFIISLDSRCLNYVETYRSLT